MSISHLLTVPHDQETRNFLQNKNDLHMIIKAMKTNDEINIETIQKFQTIESRYFTSNLLEKKVLCYFTSAVFFGFGGGKPACDHISNIRFTINKNQAICPHSPYGLGAYCHCKGKSEEFEKITSGKGQVNSTASLHFPINPFSSCTVQIFLGEMLKEVVLQEDITLEEMCKERVQHLKYFFLYILFNQAPSGFSNFLTVYFEPPASRMMEYVNLVNSDLALMLLTAKGQHS